MISTRHNDACLFVLTDNDSLLSAKVAREYGVHPGKAKESMKNNDTLFLPQLNLFEYTSTAHISLRPLVGAHNPQNR